MPRRKQTAPSPEIIQVAQRVHWWVYAVVGSAAAVAISAWSANAYLGRFAMASTVSEQSRQINEIAREVAITKTQREDDSKRIDWLVETVGQISIRQGIAPAPVAARHKVEDGR